MGDRLKLRPLLESDLDDLDRFATDPEALGPFEWFGYDAPSKRRQRWEEDGFIGPKSTMLAVSLEDDAMIGIVSWAQVRENGPGGGSFEIGVALFPEHRGQGFGTLAQRLLVEYLFSHTLANRLQATTEVDNIAEQNALERVGFQREGTMRQAVFRDGSWRDVALYSLLREDGIARRRGRVLASEHREVVGEELDLGDDTVLGGRHVSLVQRGVRVPGAGAAHCLDVARTVSPRSASWCPVTCAAIMTIAALDGSLRWVTC